MKLHFLQELMYPNALISGAIILIISPVITHTIREATQAILVFAKEVNANVFETLGRSTCGRFIDTCGDTYQQYKVIEVEKFVMKRRMMGEVGGGVLIIV